MFFLPIKCSYGTENATRIFRMVMICYDLICVYLNNHLHFANLFCEKEKIEPQNTQRAFR
ncbi:hypothetical protein EGI32_10055 [Ferruginibacter sp. HRS2-29]|nr:hypothetical protein [Ferruginibacter sp. HRS2-29]